jgi:hypothetical protein
MTWKFVSYIGSKPKSAAAIILTLAVALVLVSAGLALELSHFGRAPYPSGKLAFSLVNGNVLFTNGPAGRWYNSTSNTTEELQLYTGAKMAFGIRGSGWGTGYFGDEPQLSANTGAPSTWIRQLYVSPNITMELTDLTSNGVFDNGDTILFKMVPMQEDTVFFIGLAYFPPGSPWGDSPATYTEMSFAVHDGKLYSWYSDYLTTQEPWWEPWGN